ncbi:hypothetical protein CGMCC3_g2356 [Colletotrichum fructicola]|nr:uncharacterized protein CGMCC3_g2356 [Colletotrichum fructicola]KAE9581900.1 hypothetical protein CGMCC3_g2356 [Colletotrichum fructicola]
MTTTPELSNKLTCAVRGSISCIVIPLGCLLCDPSPPGQPCFHPAPPTWYSTWESEGGALPLPPLPLLCKASMENGSTSKPKAKNALGTLGGARVSG